jgi:putative ABC transport system ATP-binding protein/lipoprotein-releasing system ATP-binding protein
MINLDNVTKIYKLTKENSVTAVHDVSLKIEAGEFVIITGRSGSGKTTLLNLAAGLTRPTSGQVWLDGVALWSLPDRQQSLLRNDKMGFVFQFPSLLPSLTTLENVVLPTMFGSELVDGDVYQRAAGLLETVGLADKIAAYPRQLSAGQQQRVVIARSLINEPGLLLADEPTSDLDEQTEQEIMELFQAIHAKTGVTVVMVTHTSQLVAHGTRSIQMASGRITSDSAAPDHTVN